MYNYLKNIICVSLCVSSLSFLSSLHRTTYQQETRFNAPVSDSSVEHIINDFCENQEELFLTNYSTIYYRMTIGESYEGYFDLYDDIEYYVQYDSNHVVYFDQLTNEDVVGFYAVTPLRCRFANEDWMEANINAVI